MKTSSYSTSFPSAELIADELLSSLSSDIKHGLGFLSAIAD